MELPHTQCNDTLVQQIKDALVSEATLDKAENNLLTLDRNKIRSIAVMGPNAEHVELGAFGHGLSYTTFQYANIRVTPEKTGPHGTATVSVDVTNTGRIAGDEVVQMYISDEIGSVSRPVKELKGFTRIHLRPGETKNVSSQSRLTSYRF